MKPVRFYKNGITYIVKINRTIVKAKRFTRKISNKQLISEIEQCTDPDYCVLLKILLSHTIDD